MVLFGLPSKLILLTPDFRKEATKEVPRIILTSGDKVLVASNKQVTALEDIIVVTSTHRSKFKNSPRIYHIDPLDDHLWFITQLQRSPGWKRNQGFFHKVERVHSVEGLGSFVTLYNLEGEFILYRRDRERSCR